MAYAAASDLVTRYGEAEMIRLTRDATTDAEGLDLARIATAIADVSSLIDGYLRRRYAVPVSPVPGEIVHAVCVLARHELAQGDGREPTTQMIAARKDVLAWLKSVADGDVFLPLPTGNAQMISRGVPVYGDSTEPAGPGMDVPFPLPEFWP